MPERKGKPATDAPLIVDKKTTRFWALVDPKDGTLWFDQVSSEIDRGSESHDEVVLYTDNHVARRAVAAVHLNDGLILEAVEVVVRRKA
jgi:hypothetical protein